MARKKERLKDIVEEGEAELRAKERELERKLAREMKMGREMIDEEAEEFKKKVKLHPLEYVAGAFVVGFVIGKLLK